MDEALAILILEDRKADMELTRRAVLRAYPDATFTHAINEDEFLQKLGWINYDLILADYNLPGYNGLEALLHLRSTNPFMPFIFVTGTLDSEESAANAILQGANGYVLKENLRALPEQMAQAITWGKKARAENEQREKLANARRLKLQKVAGLLQQSPEFPQKEVALSLLEELTR